MIPQYVIAALVRAALILPMMVLIVGGGGRLLNSLGDATGAVWLTRLALLGGLAWVLGLVLLLVALGINAAEVPSEE